MALEEALRPCEVANFLAELEWTPAYQSLEHWVSIVGLIAH